MPECAEEKQTQHHLGAGNGHGPVQDHEYVYFAVFEDTPIDGNRLAADSFDNKSLKRDGQSVSRALFTTRKIFEEHVVRAGTNEKGACTGVAAALVETVRALQARVQLNSTAIKVRSFCVLDHVLPGDYDAHACIRFGERTTSHEANGEKITLSEKQIKTIRETARLELADVFGPICSVDSTTFAEKLSEDVAGADNAPGDDDMPSIAGK